MILNDLLKISKVRKIKFSPIDLDNSDIGGGVYRMYDKSGEKSYMRYPFPPTIGFCAKSIGKTW